jgi:hypothetical protein
MGAEVHVRRVEPEEERFAVVVRALDEIPCCRSEFIVHRLHSLSGQRPGVFDCLPAFAVRPAVQHPAGAEVLAEVGEVLRCWIVPQLRFLFGIQVIEVAEELIETVHRRQMLIPVAQMVLAELAGGVAMRLEQLGDGRVLGTHPHGGARQAHLAQPRAEHALAHNEGGATRRAALLAVAIGKEHAFVGDAVYVGRLVAHHAPAVAAEVPVTDVISPDDQNVGFSFWHVHLLWMFSPPSS